MRDGSASRSIPDDEAELDALVTLGERHTLGRYELLTPIGRGGMGTVWAARLRGTRGFSKIVALKTMNRSLSQDPQFERLFLAEAALAAKIRHPSVCAIHDLGEERGILFLVMDWVDGDSLATLSSLAGPIPCGVSVRLAADAARGLHAGERAGIVHRDISPQNVLVTADGHVSVVDFGIAKSVADHDRSTRSGYVRGKLRYLAPEQIHGEEVDGRADIFALGIVIYELTTGEHPFAAPTDLATILRIGGPDAAPRPPRSDFPEALWTVLERALSKDPAERFASIGEMAAELDALAGRLGATDDTVAAFVGPALETSRRLRAARIEAAVGDADARDQRRRAMGEMVRPEVRSSGKEVQRRVWYWGRVLVAAGGTLAASVALAVGSRSGPTQSGNISVATSAGSDALAAPPRFEPTTPRSLPLAEGRRPDPEPLPASPRPPPLPPSPALRPSAGRVATATFAAPPPSTAGPSTPSRLAVVSSASVDVAPAASSASQARFRTPDF
jgi:serine/threonine-protein kinase